MTDFMTWSNFGNFTSLVLATTIITQFVKDLKFLNTIPTRVVSYVISLVVMILASVFTGAFTWSGFALAFVNAIFVALAANGTYDACNAIIMPNSDETL